MFEGLKKKLSSFINSVAKREEEEGKEEAKEAVESKVSHEQLSSLPASPEQKIGMSHEAAEAKEEAQPAEAKEKQKKEEQEKRAEPKISAATKLKGVFLGEVDIKEKDVDAYLDELKLSLMQSDVNYDVSEKVVEQLKRNLVGSKVSSKNIQAEITEKVRRSLSEVMASGSGADILSMARKKKESGEMPFRILFVGPNDAGKTTTMGKVAHMLMQSGFSCVMSASDTFRAAAIEQTAIHAGRLGINVIKGQYGADPASVAFDAVAYAKAHGIDVVLIDSAGRQETNKSLVEEMKKMVRVAKPDMKIFIGESIAGNALLEQVKQFNEAIGLDGIILTKLDCDAKGGNTLSILSDTKVPVLYFGTGEKYTDIIPYNPNFVLDSLMP